MVLLVVAGCMKEDPSDCPKQGGVTLYFTYLPDIQKPDAFRDNIHTVKAYIFDADKLMYLDRDFTQYQLNQSSVYNGHPGWKLDDLPPGDYYAVCWGNVGAGSNFSGARDISPFDACAINIPTEVNTTGDPIYYAPYPLSQMPPHQNTRSGSEEETAQTKADLTMINYYFQVKEGEQTLKEMPFICAHRTVNVFILGYSDTPTAYGPIVQMDHLCVEYDFYMNSKGVYKNFWQVVQKGPDPHGRMSLYASFYFGFDEITEDIIIRFMQSISDSAMPLEEFSLLKYIQDNPGKVTVKDNVINVYINYDPNFDLGAHITIDNWPFANVTPTPQ